MVLREKPWRKICVVLVLVFNHHMLKVFFKQVSFTRDRSCETLPKTLKFMKETYSHTWLKEKEGNKKMLFEPTYCETLPKKTLQFMKITSQEFQRLSTLNICMSIINVLIWVFQFVNSVNNVNVDVRSPLSIGVQNIWRTSKLMTAM